MANCQTEDKRTRTAELIRPILRGRDIKRYGYEWAELWLIATFPSCHYNIDEYPAVKQYLLSFGIERLEQTGKTHIVNGKKVKARKKTNNKWFETQDSISYWEDFSKPKIVWNRIAAVKQFAKVDDYIYIQDSMHFITGDKLNYICSVLNSKIIQWLLSTIIGEAAGGNAGNADNIWNLPIPLVSLDNSVSDNYLYERYNLTNEEIAFIESQQIQ
ncbi:TaqI-like C-terminal specificity domain-containing protein [Prevotella amnii]|uniref:TaqI-like C-terminal specificity domain-containing protein n=1 Tax=Prevotella amnii TaxID=419005 RepID=UPI003EBF6674